MSCFKEWWPNSNLPLKWAFSNHWLGLSILFFSSNVINLKFYVTALIFLQPSIKTCWEKLDTNVKTSKCIQGLISFLLHIRSFHWDSPGADKIKLTELFCTTIKLWNSAFRHLFCTRMGIWHCTKSEIFNNKNADLVFDNLDLTHFP